MHRRQFLNSLAATAAGGAAGTGVAAPAVAFGLGGRDDRCGVEPPDPTTRASLSEKVRGAAWRVKTASQTQQVRVPVFFHVIQVKGKQPISKRQLNEQIRVLNADLNPYRISFSAAGGQVVKVDSIPGVRQIYELIVKPKLAKDPTQYLNFYVGPLLGGLLGYAAWPWNVKFKDKLDGVVISEDAVPGGGAKRFNTGRVAVHELGHWLGLYHTFQDGCSGSGDDIASTAAHPGPNRGCKPKSQWPKACNGQDIVPYDNIMNYTSDRCRTTLTGEQVARIHLVTRLFRSSFVTDAKSPSGGMASGGKDEAPSAISGGGDAGGWSSITQ